MLTDTKNFFATNVAQNFILFVALLLMLLKEFFFEVFLAGWTGVYLPGLLNSLVNCPNVIVQIYIQISTFWTRLLILGAIYTVHMFSQA